MRRSFTPWLSAVATLAVLTACADSTATAPKSLSRPGAGSAAADVGFSSVWADQTEGTTADGALYALFKPVNWNGDVIYYAHGIIDPELPIALPTGDDAGAIRDALGQQGFAVAYSSFSENGYDFKDGLQRTHQLRGLFTSRYGQPKRNFLFGQSLGAQIVEALAETYPDQYNGAVAVCGVLGGTKRQVDQVGHIRTLFDLMYPNWLPGTATDHVPVVPSRDQVINAAMTALQSNGFQGFGVIAAVNQTPLAGRNVPEMVQSLMTALVYHARGVNDLIDRAHGNLPFDNSETEYTGTLPPGVIPFINTSIARYTASPAAVAWLENNYEPTGQLRIPMLTLHNRFDPLVPFSHEATYAAKANAAGFGANLVQRSVNNYGHCNFGAGSAALTATTIQDLVNWVTTGTPATP
jgi:pimeloyl-ACP methyl ester carboxylesterase